MSITTTLTPARQILAHLIDTLRTHNWNVEHVNDGEDILRDVATTDDVINHVFSVAESTVVFCKGRRRHGVVLIPGNGPDVISDYDYSADDDFDDIMADHVDPFVEQLQS